jgi:tRNA A37 N6-isopentenylltransferase MiaA
MDTLNENIYNLINKIINEPNNINHNENLTYKKRYGDMYNLLSDFISDNNISLNLDDQEYEDETNEYSYEDNKYIISILTANIFCCLQVMRNYDQKVITKQYINNIITIIKKKPQANSYNSLFYSFLTMFVAIDKEELYKKIKPITEDICKDITYYNVQKNICNLFDDIFSYTDEENNWFTIGFYSFVMCIKEHDDMAELIKRYLRNIVDFNLLNNELNFYYEPNYREYIEF